MKLSWNVDALITEKPFELTQRLDTIEINPLVEFESNRFRFEGRTAILKFISLILYKEDLGRGIKILI